MNFEELKKINEDKLNFYNTQLSKATSNNINNIKNEIDIHTKIKKLLDNNPALFFQISMEDALKILSKLVDEKDLKNTYTSMINPQKFKELRQNFKI